MYRRIVKNPNYYEIAGRTPQHINDYLSELVEDTLQDLADSGCISMQETDVESANLGKIAAFYYLRHQTLEAFSSSLSQSGDKQLKMK